MDKLKVWWIPQITMKSFEVEVSNLKEAKLLLEVLADYDLFQYENRIKPDYSNTGGLLKWDEDENEWVDWMDEDDNSISDYILNKWDIENECSIKV